MTIPATSTPSTDSATAPIAPTDPVWGVDPAPVTVTGHAATDLIELLELCDEFLRTASPIVRAELKDFLDQQPSPPPMSWLIDMLGFNALYLQGKLALASNTGGQS
jgi:hypothetical protein